MTVVNVILVVVPVSLLHLGTIHILRKHLKRGGAQCFHMKVKVADLNAISQNYNFFEVKLVPFASLCLRNYLDHFFVKF